MPHGLKKKKREKERKLYEKEIMTKKKRIYSIKRKKII